MTHLTQFNKKCPAALYRTLEALEAIALCFQLRYFQELDKIEKENYAEKLISYAMSIMQETFDAMATESGDRARRKSDPQIQLLVAQGD
ncbi:unnamed protein product [Durusdinium trenchii]|uniref:Uncharacterized protein n=1 Tax=Durusdinium trenchii TaxID=1381693 RepID=A0ABP0RD69_9DINO